jgi:serine acetyltransferase
MGAEPDSGRIASVWDDSPLPPGVQVGEDVWFERHEVTFRRYRSEREVGLSIGPHSRIHTWTEFSVEPQGQIIVGARSVLVGATIMCGDRVQIGNDVVISYDVTIADCDFHPVAPAPRRQDAIAISPGGDESLRNPLLTAPVVIEDGAWIGIGAVILKGVRVGAGARVQPGAVVTRDVPPETTVAGNPAREVGPEGVPR